jgi:gamma-glutamylputrescine oxidase
LGTSARRLSYGQQEGSAEAARPGPAVPRDTDIAIVGGGLAGVSTAIAVLQRQPGIRVTLLESHFVGFGASGRNGGLISPLPAPAWLLTAKANPDHAWALRALNGRVHALGEWLAAAVPDSEVQPCSLHLQAMGRLTTSGVNEVAAVLDHAGIGHSLAPDARRGGKPTLELPTCMVHPFRLVRALAAHAAQLGAVVCEGAAVGAVEGAPGGALVHLAGGGYLRARRVVLCTNAYTASVKAPSPPRAKVVRNYMVATEPLDPEAQQQLGGGDAFIVELNKAYVFYRLHRGRLIYGGVETFFRTPKSDYDVPPFIRRALERHLAKSIPWRSLPVAMDWGGAFQSSATDLPIITASPETKAIIFNIGYGGTGVALSQIVAALAAAAALELPLPDDDARLGEIARNTRVPLMGFMRFGTRVAWDVAKRLARPWS